jgi:hypothetical protein
MNEEHLSGRQMQKERGEGGISDVDERVEWE